MCEAERASALAPAVPMAHPSSDISSAVTSAALPLTLNFVCLISQLIERLPEPLLILSQACRGGAEEGACAHRPVFSSRHATAPHAAQQYLPHPASTFLSKTMQEHCMHSGHAYTCHSYSCQGSWWSTSPRGWPQLWRTAGARRPIGPPPWPAYLACSAAPPLPL